MPITPEQKTWAEKYLQVAGDNLEHKKRAIDFLKSKGVTEMDLPELAMPKQSEGFSLGGALGALGSGAVEGFSGLTPEQAIDKPQAQSGLNVNVPFLGQVDPVRAAGQVAGSIYSPVNKIKIAGGIIKAGSGFILRNFGPSAVSALQDISDPNTGDVQTDDIIRLFGADAAGAIIGKLTKTAPIYKKAIGRVQESRANTAAKVSTANEIDDFVVQQDINAGFSDFDPKVIAEKQRLKVEQEAARQRMKPLNEEIEALKRIQQRPKKSIEQKEPPKTTNVSTSGLLKGDQFLDEEGRLLEVIERPKGRKQSLKVRDIQTGKVKTLAKSEEKKMKKISDIQLENLDYLFGEK